MTRFKSKAAEHLWELAESYKEMADWQRGEDGFASEEAREYYIIARTYKKAANLVESFQND